jgi:hypothetical protein
VDRTASASLVFEIVVGHSLEVDPDCSLPDDPASAATKGIRPCSHVTVSFVDLFDELKINDFQILPGVDSVEVHAFLNFVELAEQSEGVVKSPQGIRTRLTSQYLITWPRLSGGGQIPRSLRSQIRMARPTPSGRGRGSHEPQKRYNFAVWLDVLSSF